MYKEHHRQVVLIALRKGLYESFKYLGVQDIAYNQPKSLPYPTEKPWG